MKTPFVTKDKLEAIAAKHPTPFHIYDERGIRENARRLKAAFAWNPGFREYFAVKLSPTCINYEMPADHYGLRLTAGSVCLQR